jgi:hypothetical protein
MGMEGHFKSVLEKLFENVAEKQTSHFKSVHEKLFEKWCNFE